MYLYLDYLPPVSVKVVDIFLALSRPSKYPSLFTSTLVNNCLLLITITKHNNTDNFDNENQYGDDSDNDETTG